MKNFVRVGLCVLAMIVPAAFGQLTQITGTGFRIGGNTIPTGTVCAVAVDANENPTNVSISGGGMRGIGQSCAIISAGAITTGTGGGTFALPDEALSQPMGFTYTFTITDTGVGSITKGKSFQLHKVPGITGASFQLDRYFPTSSVTTAGVFSFTTGSGAPTVACSGKAFYQDNTVPTTPVLYSCGSDSAFHIVTGSGGTTYTGTSPIVVTDSVISAPTVATTASVTTAIASAVSTSLQKASNLSDVANVATARTNLGLGTAATTAASAYDAAGSATTAQAAAIAASRIPVPITGALADYLTVSGSGTTLVDISGNGNNGTFATLAPTWTTQGLKFAVGQGVSLPATLNTSRTQVFAVYLTSLDFPVVSGGTTSVGTYQTLLTSNAGASGDNALYALYQNSNFQGASENFSPSTYSNSTAGTACNTLIAGFNVIIRTTGTNSSTDPDHYYINGSECSTYNVQTASAAFQASVGNYYIGAPPTGLFSATSGLTGVLYRAAFLSAEATAAQAATISAQVQASIQVLGVPLVQPSFVLGTPQLLVGVDSITYGYTTANPPADNWAANLALTVQTGYTIRNFGVTGSFISANSAAAPNREGRLCKSARGPSVEIIFGGTNDIAGLFTPAITFQALASMVKTEKQAGCIVGVGTMLSRIGTGVDTNKDAYDNLILTSWKQIGADFVVDFAANPLMGADGANANRTYFFTDGIHPTIAGQLLLASAASNSWNYFFGSNLGNPNVVTATTYQMLSSDGVVTASPTANAAYTLPDCTGPSGASYVISNPSSFVVTIVGGTNQPINGLTSPINIVANSTVTLHDVANPKSVSGCHWVM